MFHWIWLEPETLKLCNFMYFRLPLCRASSSSSYRLSASGSDLQFYYAALHTIRTLNVFLGRFTLQSGSDQQSIDHIITAGTPLLCISRNLSTASSIWFSAPEL